MYNEHGELVAYLDSVYGPVTQKRVSLGAGIYIFMPYCSGVGFDESDTVRCRIFHFDDVFFLSYVFVPKESIGGKSLELAVSVKPLNVEMTSSKNK